MHQEQWSIEQSDKLYNLSRWGGGYFCLNAKGELEIDLKSTTGQGINLPQLAEKIRQQNIGYPVLLRFPHILQHRLQSLNSAFANAIAEQNYSGSYTPIYPIKVNQQKSVLQALLNTPNTKMGLEAGSKPELMAILALSHNQPNYLICNGYKDKEFIQLAFLGKKLGHNLFIVVEKLAELDLVIQLSKELNIKPSLGVRLRLDSISKGKWQNSGGEKSKFGLTASQVLQMLDKLENNNMLDCLELLHFHLGSQIADIEDLQQGLIESATLYAEIKALGANLNYIDVGGGLGVDYTGTRNRHEFSLNYTMAEYANTVVATFLDTCKKRQIAMPNIFSESGRAISAHHAILLTNVADIEQGVSSRYLTQSFDEKSSKRQGQISQVEKIAKILHNLQQNLDETYVLEAYHQVSKELHQAQTLFKAGNLNLKTKAIIEDWCFYAIYQIKQKLNLEYKSHREIHDELGNRFADKLFVNFSLFQSLPDIWGLGQIFPIMPIKGLTNKPQIKSIVQDITCDSDGRVDLYVKGQDLETSLSLPAWQAGEEKLLAFFLVGAYQEILGDMHNLFGTTNSLSVVVQDGQILLQDIKRGARVADVLDRVNYDSDQLESNLLEQIQQKNMDTEFWRKLITEGIQGYTYLED